MVQVIAEIIILLKCVRHDGIISKARLTEYLQRTSLWLIMQELYSNYNREIWHTCYSKSFICVQNSIQNSK